MFVGVLASLALFWSDLANIASVWNTTTQERRD
jgi:hypothetical protein